MIRYKVLFDNADDAILIWQLNDKGEAKIVDANRAACERYGYAHDEIIGLTGANLNTPESLANAPPVILTNGHFTVEVTHLTKQGKPIPTEVKAHRFLHNGRWLAVSVCRDISERKELERRRQEILEGECQLRAKLEADNTMRTNYIRALVHELKTPITSLMVSSDHLMDTLKEGPSYSFAKNIAFGAESLNHRIDELHDLIRLETGTLRLETYPVDLCVLLHDVSNFVRPLAERGEISFQIQMPDNVPMVCGDRERLQQVLLNLLNNALKYTPKKGSVWLKAAPGPKEVVIEVRDTGCGITKEGQEDLFKPYYHRNPAQQKTDGLGLGLVISKAIIERYKGRMWVESQPGEGSQFFISLPIMEAEAKNEGINNR